ncbi:hypothetical protein BD410DRAFT_809495 [Rickenella mellea]|uniref:Zn(2)-C6 fungal-type domain-containing protein n=1 Tax=Rickenella mellea TaxID=50990 RepID=A0A4Y7PH95_9AGAM|nr:hypothetical protein BD410DRAFT_809495 [Rickenella mellea]
MFHSFPLIPPPAPNGSANDRKQLPPNRNPCTNCRKSHLRCNKLPPYDELLCERCAGQGLQCVPVVNAGPIQGGTNTPVYANNIAAGNPQNPPQAPTYNHNALVAPAAHAGVAQQGFGANPVHVYPNAQPFVNQANTQTNDTTNGGGTNAGTTSNYNSGSQN